MPKKTPATPEDRILAGISDLDKRMRALEVGQNETVVALAEMMDMLERIAAKVGIASLDGEEDAEPVETPPDLLGRFLGKARD